MVEYNKDTERGDVTIQGETFTIPRPFAEGHVCNDKEADVLNQILAENVRNNRASFVKKAKDEGKFNAEEMQAEIDTYVSEYEFGIRRSGGGSSGPKVSPVERLANNKAWDIIKMALKKKGIKITSVSAEQKAVLVAQYLEQRPEIMKEAEKELAKQQKAAEQQLDDIDLSSLGAAEDEAEAA